MHTEWQGASQAPSDYHDDPALGGPPVVSPDVHWWWDGRRWVLRHPEQPAA